MVIDEIGKRFTRLVVLKRTKHSNKSAAFWLCRCDCGKIVIARGWDLRKGTTKSCGCWKDDLSRMRKTRLSHGLAHTPINNVYKGLKSRCENKNSPSFKNYGGRGIKCLWKTFEDFYKDMGDIPEKGLTIDRIDNDGNYCKENCRWATKYEQANNRRTARLLTFNGKTQNLKTWAKELNMRTETLFSRVVRKGWPIDKALSIPVRNINGEKLKSAVFSP